MAYFGKQNFLGHKHLWKNANLKSFGHETHVDSGDGSQSSSSAIFRDLKILHFFDILNFLKKLTICSNDLGRTRESLSRLDLAIPFLDIAPTYTGNRTFWVKNRDFSNLEHNSGL